MIVNDHQRTASDAFVGGEPSEILDPRPQLIAQQRRPQHQIEGDLAPVGTEKRWTMLALYLQSAALADRQLQGHQLFVVLRLLIVLITYE